MTDHTHETIGLRIPPLCPDCHQKMKRHEVGLFDDYYFTCPLCSTHLSGDEEVLIEAIHCTDCDKIIYPVEEPDGALHPHLVYTDGCPTCERIRTETQRHDRAISLLRNRYGTTKPQSIKDFFIK